MAVWGQPPAHGATERPGLVCATRNGPGIAGAVPILERVRRENRALAEERPSGAVDEDGHVRRRLVAKLDGTLG